MVDSSAKYFVTRQQCRVDPLLHSRDNSEHLYCWRLHVGQQYKANALLRLHDNSGYANAPHCYVIRTYIASTVTVYISVCHKLTWSRDSSVIIVAALRVGQRGDLDLISGRNKSFVLSRSVETGCGLHPVSYLTVSGCSFHGSKAVGAWSWTLMSVQCWG